MRLGANLDGQTSFPTLPPGPVSVAQLYTLTEDQALKGFDITTLPADILLRIVIPILQHVEASQLDESINAVRARYLDLSRKPLQTPLDDAGDDDYEPEFEPLEDREQIINKMDRLPEDDFGAADIDLGPFQLPQPLPLSQDEAEQLGKGAISRVFSMASHVGALEKVPQETSGFNRMAGSNFDKDAWITVLTRLATRASPELLDDNKPADAAAVANKPEHGLGDGIRETLWKYIVEDFRRRIHVAIAWLNEEWYADRVAQLQGTNTESSKMAPAAATPNYDRWVHRLLDVIIPYLDASDDKVLVRFVSEIPQVDAAIIDRIKALAKDPDRVKLTVKTI